MRSAGSFRYLEPRTYKANARGRIGLQGNGETHKVPERSDSAVRRNEPVLFPRLHPWQLLKEGFNAFLEDNALTRGAAIAFYAVTAIAPVLFIATAIAGMFLGPAAASSAVHYQLRQLMSPESANLLQD